MTIIGVEWFGPRDPGWGWTPVTWEGWVIIAASLAMVFAIATFAPTRIGTTRTTALIVLVMAALLGVIALTGTPPG